MNDSIAYQHYGDCDSEPVRGDDTAQTRRDMIAAGQPQADLAADPDRKWTTEQLRDEFEVLGFMAPFVTVRRKSDGALGSLEFTHSPRAYFGWRAHEDD
jgi:hypothetical protein